MRSDSIPRQHHVKRYVTLSSILLAMTAATNAGAVTSAEIYTSDAYAFGRYSARIQYAPGSGVVSSFFLWKDKSEQEGVFWNELDFEKLEGECRMETNTIYGDPEGIDPEKHVLAGDLCGEYHVYTYEWTPEYIAWLVDGVEIRRETGEAAVAFRDNAAEGMQLRFNVWPGDETFGGEFDPAILPVYEYIDWVEYSSYADGAFTVEWREDFTAGTLPSGWLTASWDSPKGLSTHDADNVGFKDGYVILALTADDAIGTAGGNPSATDTQQPPTPVPTDVPVTPPGGTTTAPTTTAPGETTVAPTAPGTVTPPTGSTAPVTSTDATEDPAGGSCTVGARGSDAYGLASLMLGLGVAVRRRFGRKK